MEVKVVAAGLAAALSMVLAGCGADVTGSPMAQGVSVQLSPDAPRVPRQTSLSFSAVVTGTIDTTVTWSIQEGPTGGSISASGLYTAPATAGTYRVVATSTADPTASGVATVTVTDAPTTPPGTGAMTTASRTSGVAPLAVFFDAVETVPQGYASPYTWTTGVAQPADLEGATWEWDFGDPGSGTWTQTGNSRNTATGYTAAHVYEQPGTYTATLAVTGQDGVKRRYAQTITVAPFAGTTYYVSAAGSDQNDGRSPATAFQTAAKGLSMLTAPNTAVLFRRGDTFSTGTSIFTLRTNGPNLIGAYGTGARPIIDARQCPAGATLIEFRSAVSKTTYIEDWRIMDLDVVGPGPVTAGGGISFNVEWAARNFTFLRNRFRSMNVGFGWSDWTPVFQLPREGMAVVENESDSAYQNGMYLGGYHLALLGNDVHDVGYSHALRVWQAHKAVISNNRLWRPGGQRHALKLHGNNKAVLVGGVYSPYGTPGGTAVEPGRETCPETRWVTINDNVFKAGDLSNWTISMGPQDSISDERVSHVVFERNRTLGGPATLIDVETSASQVMVRNNVFDATLDGEYTGVYVHRRGIEPVPTGYRVYNNTFYKGSANKDTKGFDFGPEVADARIRNNLLAFQAGGNVTTSVGGGGAGWAIDHNLLTDAPGFASAAGGDFSLVAGSPAADAGTALWETILDLAGTGRPRGAGYDLGAIESR